MRVSLFSRVFESLASEQSCFDQHNCVLLAIQSSFFASIFLAISFVFLSWLFYFSGVSSLRLCYSFPISRFSMPFFREIKQSLHSSQMTSGLIVWFCQNVGTTLKPDSWLVFAILNFKKSIPSKY